ncbi:MAG: flagellar filament capping protein FliD, partial [Chloroflexota bacterium]
SSITPYGDKAVFSATASSSAIAGDYDVSVQQLATAHSVRGVPQASSDTALGYSGTFYIGGRRGNNVLEDPEDTLQGPTATELSLKTRIVASDPPSDPPTVFSVIQSFSTVADTSATSALDSGRKQMGDGDYRVEVRKNESTWQFRIVDSDSGSALSIRNGSDTANQTSTWQNITAGEYNTGRGLKINFADPASYSGTEDQGVAGELTYAAQGAKISVLSSDSQKDIAAKINAATYAEGNEVNATIVDRRLVVTAKSTGRTMTASETYANEVLRDLGILGSSGTDNIYNTFVPANQTTSQKAIFKVNGIPIERRSNTNLTNVAMGVTLSLTGKHADWTTQSDKLTVTEDMTAAKTAITDFLAKFNEVMAYIDEGSSTTKIADNQYSRGGLADDTIFADLRQNLYSAFSTEYGSTYQRANRPDRAAGDNVSLGAIKRLYDIGINLDDNLTPSVVDEDKLNDALTNHLADTKSLLNAVMGAMDDQLGRFTGNWGDYGGSSTTSYMSSIISNVDSQTTQMTTSIKE